MEIVVELVGGGSVINGATQTSFLVDSHNFHVTFRVLSVYFHSTFPALSRHFYDTFPAPSQYLSRLF